MCQPLPPGERGPTLRERVTYFVAHVEVLLGRRPMGRALVANIPGNAKQNDARARWLMETTWSGRRLAEALIGAGERLLAESILVVCDAAAQDAMHAQLDGWPALRARLEAQVLGQAGAGEALADRAPGAHATRGDRRPGLIVPDHARDVYAVYEDAATRGGPPPRIKGEHGVAARANCAPNTARKWRDWLVEHDHIEFLDDGTVRVHGPP